MKVLVTGATGLIGSHLSRKLFNEGLEVYSLVRRSKKNSKQKILGKVIEGDLTDLSWVELLPSDLDAVIHLAGVVHSHRIDDFYKVNSNGTLRLLDSLKKRFMNQKISFLLISSLAAAGPGTIDLSSCDSPIGHYGKSKKLGEEYLMDCQSQWIKKIIRPPMVIGPGDAAFQTIYEMVKSGWIFASKGQKKYSFICVHDLVNGIHKVLIESREGTHDTVYFSHSEILTFPRLINTIAEIMKVKKIRIIYLPHFFLFFLGNIISFLASYCSKLTKIRLTKDKVFEIVASEWVCDSRSSNKKYGMIYNWNLECTIDNALRNQEKNYFL